MNQLNGWLTEVEIEEFRGRCKRSDEQVEVKKQANEEKLDMRHESEEDGNCINDKESFQKIPDKQGFDDEEKELLNSPDNIPPNMKYAE